MGGGFVYGFFALFGVLKNGIWCLVVALLASLGFLYTIFSQLPSRIAFIWLQRYRLPAAQA